MARTKKNEVSAAPKQLTAEELNNWYKDNQISYADKIEFDVQKAQKTLQQIKDITKNYNVTTKTFDKGKLRQYIRDIAKYAKDLRSLSWYLYYRSMTYSRIINFNSNMFCLYARSIVPKYDIVKGMDSTKVLTEYQKTIDEVDHMRLQQEFLPIYKTCFIQDIYYGVYLHDETGVFHFPLPADYCKITGKYMSGDFAYALDASWLKNRQELIEYMPIPFKTIWDEYQKNPTTNRWVLMPEECAVCLKWGVDDLDSAIPPFTPLFNSVINLSDLEDIQAIGDEANIYKMLWVELETISGSKNVDDWKVDPALLSTYFNKFINDALPPYISAAIIPGKLNEVSFDNDEATDTTKVARATEQVLNTAGGAEILNGGTINNTYAFKMASIANTEFAISSLLPQTQSWVTRMLSYEGADGCIIKFFPVSVYTKETYRDELLTNAQYGLPTKIAINTLSGFSEKDTLALNFLEEDVLHLSEKLKPLNSSYTQSSTEDGYTSEVGQGAPTKDEGDLSDSGERSRNQ